MRTYLNSLTSWAAVGCFTTASDSLTNVDVAHWNAAYTNAVFGAWDLNISSAIDSLPKSMEPNRAIKHINIFCNFVWEQIVFEG